MILGSSRLADLQFFRARRKKVKNKLFYCVLVSLLFPIAAYAQDPYQFVLRWGDGQLGKPVGIAIDSQGVVFVSDHLNNRIQKYDKNGHFVANLGSPGSGDSQFYHPYSIAIDSADNLYVADYGNFRIQKFDKDGNFVAKWGSYGLGDGQFSGPAYVAASPDGYIYVTERWAPDRVQKFDADGKFITKWGGTGTGDGQFNFPAGIAVDNDGYVYVCDHYNHRVQKFDADGHFVAKWGSYGSGDGQFNLAIGIDIDPYGYIYVTSEDRFQKFGAEGNFITRGGSYGYGDGQFVTAYGIAIDSERYVYAVDGYLVARVQKFAPPLTYGFEGFLSPIENPPTVNKAKAGQTIPVIWRLTDRNGLPVSDPASFNSIKSIRVSCGSFVGEPTSVVDEPATGSSGLQYLGDGWWQYNWKTSKAYSGQCRTLKLTFNDYTVYSANFSFK
jgi:sugar lactone lactonase YvrE